MRKELYLMGGVNTRGQISQQAWSQCDLGPRRGRSDHLGREGRWAGDRGPFRSAPPHPPALLGVCSSCQKTALAGSCSPCPHPDFQVFPSMRSKCWGLSSCTKNEDNSPTGGQRPPRKMKHETPAQSHLCGDLHVPWLGDTCATWDEVSP